MALLEVLLPAVVGGLFGLMQGDPEIPEPPKPRKPKPQFIPPGAAGGAAMPVDPGASMPIMSATPQSQLAALSMFNIDSDDKNPFKLEGLV